MHRFSQNDAKCDGLARILHRFSQNGAKYDVLAGGRHLWIYGFPSGFGLFSKNPYMDFMDLWTFFGDFLKIHTLNNAF